MLETPHVAVGAAIAAKIHPALALPAALASHFILDKIPHWNPHAYTEVKTKGRISNSTILISIGDVILALSLGLFIAYQALPNYSHAGVIIAASFLSVLPDVSKSPYFFFKELRKGRLKEWVDFERSLQVDTNFVLGNITQISIIVMSLVWVLA